LESKNLSSEVLFDAFPKQIEFIENCLSGDYRFIGYFGSIRGGKTFALLGLFIMLAKMFPNSRWVVCRKDLERIKTTVFPTFYSIVPESFTESMPTSHNQWTWKATNGSIIKFFAENIDKDPELKRFRGLEYDGIGFEEMDIAKKTFYKGFERAGTWRMKWRKEQIKKGLQVPPSIVCGTSNPQSGWVKSEIYEPFINGKINPQWNVTISKIYDNPHVTQEYIQGLKDTLTFIDFLKFVEGDWSVNENDKPFIHAFNSDIHVLKENVDYFKGEPILISFDFNINPTTAVLMQKIPGKGVFILDCIQVKGGTEVLCEELEWTIYHPSGIEVTGDYSGNSGSTTAGLLPGGVYNTDFEIIKKVLRLGTFQLINTMRVNPKHEHSRRVCNYLLEKCPVYFNPKAKALIYDIQIGQATDQGKLRKDRDQFKMDAMDAWRYGVNAMFPNGLQDIVKFVENLL